MLISSNLRIQIPSRISSDQVLDYHTVFVVEIIRINPYQPLPFFVGWGMISLVGQLFRVDLGEISENPTCFH